MNSLFLVSLPRSLSTRIYRAARDATGLEPVSWAWNGEILNHDLLAMSRWPKLAEGGHQFVTRQNDPQRFRSLTDYLDQAARSSGMIYKDVVNPFVVAAWPRLSEFRVLKIRRDLADVAAAMLRRGWYGPLSAVPKGDPLLASPSCRFGRHYLWSVLARRMLPVEPHMRFTAQLCRSAMLKGLVMAAAEIERLPGETVDYEDLVESEEVLESALRRLYPGTPIRSVRYIDAEFRRRRANLRERARTQRGTLERQIDEIRCSLADSAGAASP